MIDDIAQRKRKTPYTSSQRGSSITSFSYTNQGSKDPMTGKMRQIYFGKLASAPAQEVFLKEYFSTAYDFDKDSLEKALDIYNGWRKSSFSTCNCQNLTQLTRADFGEGDDILKFKGTCLKTKIKQDTRVESEKVDIQTEVGYTSNKKFVSMQPDKSPKPGEELLPYHLLIIDPSVDTRAVIQNYSLRWDLDYLKKEKEKLEDDDDGHWC